MTIDEIIWNIFQEDLKSQGFDVSPKGICLSNLSQFAFSRGGFSIGQLVYKAWTEDWAALTFDDITGAPYRALASREDADITTHFAKGKEFPSPLVSSNMECVTGADLAITMAMMGGAGVLHQFGTHEQQVEELRKVKSHSCANCPVNIDEKSYCANLDENGLLYVGAAIGVSATHLERAEALVLAGANFLVVDIAHGHSDQMINAIKKLKRDYPGIPVVAGNVVTPKGAYELCEAGADVLKVGVGPGAACTTRIVTGYGIPQITAIYETSLIAKKYGVCVMADGGIRTSGDIVKALAAGADTVMLGGLLAATNESNQFEERILEHDPGTGLPSKIEYYGSASAKAKKKQERGAYDAPEGKTKALQYEGETKTLIAQLLTGVKSGISYSGNSRDPEKDENANITRLRKKSRWIRQSIAGAYEGSKGQCR